MEKNKVIIAGAGPGDPELISLKALRYLKSADVILIDRLVSPELVQIHVKPSTKVIYVGKQCSKGVSTPQEYINEQMVYYATQGKLVVRLKGGDVSIFSNILDELQTLKKHGIAYEIIPGISSALGAAAYCGIPLTARGYSKSVRFCTLIDTQDIDAKQWEDWSRTTDTLVFYMSGRKLKDLVCKFLEFKVDPEKEIAVIEQASTVFQKTYIYNFQKNKLSDLVEFQGVPTLIIVGKVVNLHESFAWKKEFDLPGCFSYFDNPVKETSYAI